MEASALVKPLARVHVRPGVRVSESRLFRAAVALIALHIIDDEFLQPPPGTAIQDHLRAGLLPIGGYGVLLYDARGRGQSQGAPDAYGWTWGRDVDAAITWLEHRPDVKPGRIGALGLSTGADVLIEAAARRHDIRAVVADGATTRSTDDTQKVIHGGGLLSLPFWWTQYTAAETFENASPGPPLAALAAHLHTRILLIASTWSVERTASRIYARAAKQPGDLWEVDAGHTHGLHDHPRLYAQHVLSFFATTLLQQR